jgi:hypothetical protein
VEDLPKATAVRAPSVDDPDPLKGIVRQWIRWLPASIAFFGLSFVAWTIIMILQVGRYHDALTRVEQRLKQIEKEHEKCLAPK